VSHELRTPLTTIGAPLGMLETLMAQDPASRELFAIVMRSVKRMKRLVDDILDMERLLHGRLPLQAEAVPMATLLENVVAEMDPIAVLRGVALEVESAVGTALGDPLRLSQVLANLLDNAIAFSPSGATVTLRAEHRMDDICVSVTDRGPGIPKELHQPIFEPFRQGELSATRRKGGTGLGLAVARSIVEQHGGGMWVESEPGRGSSFFFTLPLAEGDHKQTGEA
jgi:signal transduction histidine kinase